MVPFGMYLCPLHVLQIGSWTKFNILILDFKHAEEWDKKSMLF